MPVNNSPALWPAKDPAEVLAAAFDFTAALDGAETIASQAVSISTRSGTDASPAAVLSGDASRAGAVVTQRLQGGVDAATYLIRCAATTSTGRVLVLAGVLPVRALS